MLFISTNSIPKNPTPTNPTHISYLTSKSNHYLEDFLTYHTRVPLYS